METSEQAREIAAEPGPDRGWLWTAGQIVAAGVVGGILSSGVVGVLVFFLMTGPVVLLAALAFAIGALVVVAYVTQGGSPLTGAPGGRVLWAVGVLVLGLVNLAVGATVVSKAGLHVGTDTVWGWLLSGLPFALAAGVWAGRWTSVVSLALTVALVVAGCT
ncbi:hypothetical protein [Nonomuraea pusilla]|uniref:Uncharacterized protein n=1 Tax=Nonomuraea pusilla TaxID=46177 RepID=A0A1H8EW27_9ACTN|nr:hypothetical protein [Nonomuraea pusilla]SEN23600.1 hypothetical protein SAMN05660976_07127 [Nonomuraea pusilla]